MICNGILQFFVDFVDFDVIFSDKIQTICRWLVLYPKNCVEINKIDGEIVVYYYKSTVLLSDIVIMSRGEVLKS